MKLKTLTGEEALAILQELVDDLSGIEDSDMTTFELRLLKKCVENPPKREKGTDQAKYEWADETLGTE